MSKLTGAALHGQDHGIAFSEHITPAALAYDQNLRVHYYSSLLANIYGGMISTLGRGPTKDLLLLLANELPSLQRPGGPLSQQRPRNN